MPRSNSCTLSCSTGTRRVCLPGWLGLSGTMLIFAVLLFDAHVNRVQTLIERCFVSQNEVRCGEHSKLLSTDSFPFVWVCFVCGGWGMYCSWRLWKAELMSNFLSSSRSVIYENLESYVWTLRLWEMHVLVYCPIIPQRLYLLLSSGTSSFIQYDHHLCSTLHLLLKHASELRIHGFCTFTLVGSKLFSLWWYRVGRWFRSVMCRLKIGFSVRFPMLYVDFLMHNISKLCLNSKLWFRDTIVIQSALVAAHGDSGHRQWESTANGF